MGAWGVGIFEDDTALDWIEEEYSAAGVEAVRSALQDVIDLDSGDYIEADMGNAARAAAEIVALAFDAGAEDAGSDMAETLAEHAEQVAEYDDLPALALVALARITGEGSELQELWAEAGGETTAAWDNAMADLVARLEGVK